MGVPIDMIKYIEENREKTHLGACWVRCWRRGFVWCCREEERLCVEVDKEIANIGEIWYNQSKIDKGIINMKYIIVARIVDKKRLIGLKVYSGDGKISFIDKSQFSQLFENEVLNCTYKNRTLESTIKGLEIKKFPRYNKNLAREHILDNYTEAYILSQVTNKDEDETAYRICGAIISGGITDIYSDAAEKHAKIYYEEIRSMKTDVSKIAANTGFTIPQIRYVKNYLFMDEHDLSTGIKRFDPSFAIAQSWQRLMSKNGKDIQPHDLILIQHELCEANLVMQGFGQDEAHFKASELYNYTEESDKYYQNLALEGGK